MNEASIAPPRSGLREAGLRLLGDERLSRLAASGDVDAFAVIYERYHQALYRYCRSILNDPEDASDALQNAMSAALRSLPGEARAVALKPWLFRVAHNEAISLARRRRPNVELSGEEVAGAADPQQEAELRERLAGLVGDLRRLPDNQRGALVMRELSGLSYGEIAAALTVSESAAKQAVYHARLGLHELAQGRAMECEAALRLLSDRDGRVLRGRRLRAHLRDCESCSAFAAARDQRRADLAAIAPPLPAAAAAALLHGLLGGGGMGGGGGLLGLLGPGAGKLAGGGLTAKAAGATSIALLAGAGVVAFSPSPDAAPPPDRNGAVTQAGAGGADQPSLGSRDLRPGGGAGGHAGQPRQRQALGANPGGSDREVHRVPVGSQGRERSRLAPPARGGSPRPTLTAPAPARSGRPGRGGSASGPGRGKARTHVPRGLPAPAQRGLGGDGQAPPPTSRAPDALLRPAPPATRRVPGPRR